MQIKINNSTPISIAKLESIYFSYNGDKLEYTDIADSNFSFSINHHTYGLVLKNNFDNSIKCNHYQIHEKAFISTGDKIKIGSQSLCLIDEEALPVEKNKPKSHSKENKNSRTLLTSVTGLRSFEENQNGELFLIAKGKNYRSNSKSFRISSSNNQLNLTTEKDAEISLNGNRVNFSTLKNGDVISHSSAKYQIESPGTTSYSKYSPSHPNNIPLNEKIIAANPSKIKKHLWWISMVAGLIAITIVLVLLKNSTT